jgi:hypothetical protein
MAKEYMTSRATALLPLPLRCLSPFGAEEESRGHERHLKFGYWSFPPAGSCRGLGCGARFGTFDS